MKLLLTTIQKTIQREGDVEGLNYPLGLGLRTKEAMIKGVRGYRLASVILLGLFLFWGAVSHAEDPVEAEAKNGVPSPSIATSLP